MLAECWAIVVIIIAMMFIFLRAGKKSYALAVLPLTFTPIFHMMGYPFSRFFSSLLSLPAMKLHMGLDIFALIAAALVYGVCSAGFKKSRIRVVYLITCGIFNLGLSCVLIFGLL